MELIIVLCLIALATSKVTLQAAFAKKHISMFSDGIAFNGIIFLFSLLGFVGALKSSAQVLVFGAAFGILTVLFQACYVKAMSSGNVSLIVFIVNSSMIIPLFVSKIFYGEQFGILRIIGIVVIFIALAFSVELKKEKSNQSKWLLLTIAAFFLNGGLAVCQQIFGKSLWKAESASFVAWSYFTATLVSFGVYLILLLKGEKTTFKINRTSLGYGIGTGIALGVFQFMNTRAIAVIDAGFLFPVYNGGTLVLTTVTSVFLLKDKLNFKQIVSIVLGITGIVLMNM